MKIELLLIVCTVLIRFLCLYQGQQETISLYIYIAERKREDIDSEVVSKYRQNIDCFNGLAIICTIVAIGLFGKVMWAEFSGG